MSLEILAVLEVRWDLDLQDFQELLVHQGVQVVPDHPVLLAPLGGPEHQPAPEDPSPPADLQIVKRYFYCKSRLQNTFTIHYLGCFKARV